MIINDELHTHTLSLDSMHLGHAIDLMRRSKLIAESAHTGWDKSLVHRCAVSGILHGFCALENVVNLSGYEMFFHPESARYVPPDKRDFLLKRFVKTWRRAAILDKLEFILHYGDQMEIPDNLGNRLRELNTMRNCIAHGFIYTRTFLLESTGNSDDGEFYVYDAEDSADWRRKFPSTRFKSLDSIDYEDTRIALTIVLEALKLLSESMQQPVAIFTCEYPPEYRVLWGESFDIEEALKYEFEEV